MRKLTVGILTFAIVWGAPVSSSMLCLPLAHAVPPVFRGKPKPDRPDRIFRGHRAIVADVAFSPDGQTVASASWDGTVRLWKLGEGSLSRRIKSRGWCYCVAFSPDGKTLAIGSSDKTIRLWDLAAGELRLKLKGHARSVRSVAFSSDGKRLATASNDKVVKLWDVQTGQNLASYSRGVGVVFLPDGATLASRRDERVLFWDRTTGRTKAEFKHDGKVTCFAIAPDGKSLAAAFRLSGDPQALKLAAESGLPLMLWDVETGKAHRIATGHATRISSLAFSPDGTTVASAGFYAVKLWNTEEHRLAATLRGHAELVSLPRWKGKFIPNPNQITSVAFSPDGKMIAEGSGQLLTRGVPTSRALKLFPPPIYKPRGHVSLWEVDGPH